MDTGKSDRSADQRYMLPARDWRTIYLHELAVYNVIVRLTFLQAGAPPFWVFAVQGVGHMISAMVSNKFFWWYGRRAKSGVSRLPVIGAGCGWIVAGYLSSPR
jgi:hypothetical protein